MIYTCSFFCCVYSVIWICPGGHSCSSSVVVSCWIIHTNGCSSLGFLVTIDWFNGHFPYENLWFWYTGIWYALQSPTDVGYSVLGAAITRRQKFRAWGVLIISKENNFCRNHIIVPPAMHETSPHQKHMDSVSWSSIHGYGSIPINTMFRVMNIHLPAISGFTRYQGFDPSPHGSSVSHICSKVSNCKNSKWFQVFKNS